MRWEDERYVRLYTRDTPEWVALSWEARALFAELLRKVDRAGLIQVGRSGVRGLAGLLRMPTEVVELALAELVADGSVSETEGGYLLPNFIAAQESKQSDAARKREQRERARVDAMGSPVTFRDQVSRSVTDCPPGGQKVTTGHTESRPVTDGHSVLSRAVPSRAEPDPPVVPLGDAPAAPAPKPAKRVKRPETACPDSDATDAEVEAWLAAVDVPAVASQPWGPHVAAWLDRSRAKGERYSDWTAAWMTWARRAVGYGHTDADPKQARRSRQPSPVQRETASADPPPNRRLEAFIAARGGSVQAGPVPADPIGALLAMVGNGPTPGRGGGKTGLEAGGMGEDPSTATSSPPTASQRGAA